MGSPAAQIQGSASAATESTAALTQSIGSPLRRYLPSRAACWPCPVREPAETAPGAGERA